MHPEKCSFILRNRVTGVVLTFISICFYVFYLKGSQTELYEDSGLCSGVFRQEGEYHVVHPEQRNEKQSGFGQSPAHTCNRETHCDYVCECRFMPSCMNKDNNSASLEVTGIIATDTRRSQLLHQNTDHVDEDDKIDLHDTNKDQS